MNLKPHFAAHYALSLLTSPRPMAALQGSTESSYLFTLLLYWLLDCLLDGDVARDIFVRKNWPRDEDERGMSLF